MKKVIVTGATGCIGVNLCDFLIQNDIEVTALIRKNSKRKSNLLNYPKMKIIECNLDELNSLDLFEKYDVFFHLGWAGSEKKSRNNVYLQNLNVKYTLDAIELAKKCECETFIGAGSQAEYGRIDGIIDENTKTNPDNAYGSAKLCAFHLGKIYAKQLGISFIWPRIFSVYGPYDSDNTMIMSSIKMMLNGLSPEYTLGEQNWNYLFVEDAVKILYLLAEHGIDGNIYCVGSDKTLKLVEFIKIMKNTINPEIGLKLGAIPYSENQVMNLNVNISKLKKDLNFIPKIDFEEGIKKTIEWYIKTNGVNDE